MTKPTFICIFLSKNLDDYNSFNCIYTYNKILDRDWFSARLFVTQSASDHVGIQLHCTSLLLDTCNWIPRDSHVNLACFNGFLRNISYSYDTPFSLKRSSQKAFCDFGNFVIDTINYV